MTGKAMGAVLQIPQELFDKLEQADRAISALADSSEKTRGRVEAAFKAMGASVENDFAAKIKAAQEVLTGLDQEALKKVAKALQEIGKENKAKEAANDVKSIGEASANAAGGVSQASQQLDSLAAKEKSAQEQSLDLKRTLGTLKEELAMKKVERMDVDLVKEDGLQKIRNMCREIAVLEMDIKGLEKPLVSYRTAIQAAMNAKDAGTMKDAIDKLKLAQHSLVNDTDKYKAEILMVNNVLAETQKMYKAETASTEERIRLKQREVALEKQKQEAANKANSKRLTNLSDLKMPQNALDFAKSAGTAERQKKALDNLKAAYSEIPKYTSDVDGYMKKFDSEIQRLTASLNTYGSTAKKAFSERVADYKANADRERSYGKRSDYVQTSDYYNQSRKAEEDARKKAMAEAEREYAHKRVLADSQLSAEVAAYRQKEASDKAQAKAAENRAKQKAAEDKAQAKAAEDTKMRVIANIEAMKKKMLELEYYKKRLSESKAKADSLGISSAVVTREIDKIEQEMKRLGRFNNHELMKNKRFNSVVFNTSNQADIQRGYQEAKRIQDKANADRERANNKTMRDNEVNNKRMLENVNSTEKAISRITMRINEMNAALFVANGHKQKGKFVDTSSLEAELNNLERQKREFEKHLTNRYPMDKNYAHKTFRSSEYDTNMRVSKLELDRVRAANKEIEREEARKNSKIASDQKKANNAKEAEERRHRKAMSNMNLDSQRIPYRRIRSTPENALAIADDAKNVGQYKKALEALELAKSNLAKKGIFDASYYKNVELLNLRIRDMRARLQESANGARELSGVMARVTDIGGQLGRQLAMVFSVRQIENYVTRIAEVRGEMELNQISLRAILNERQKADNIFNKTKQLAVHSPFRVGQLVTYTKQLAAYRIEEDKLFETTKRLADVSAGLGVDMQRLILAYGQVKAAKFLKGTEVRQFTEAGLNVYGELQRYFEQVEGKTYSTMQIVDMISKKKVTFEAIEQVFKNLTDEGGIFYNMQEIQSNTLHGKIEKLKDQFYLLQDAIGKSTEGVLKGTVDAIASLMSNWQKYTELIYDLIPVILSMAAAWKFNASAMMMSQSWFVKTRIGMAKAMGGFLSFTTVPQIFAGVAGSIQVVLKALSGLGKAFLANLPIAAVLLLAKYFYDLYAATKKYDEAVSNANAEYYKNAIQLNKIIKKSQSDIKSALAELAEMLNKEGFDIEIKPNISEEDAKAEFEKLKGLQAEYITYLKNSQVHLGADEKDGNRTFLRDVDLKSNLKAYDDAASRMVQRGEGMRSELIKLSQEAHGFTLAQKEMLVELSEGPKQGADIVKFYQDAYNKLIKLRKTNGSSIFFNSSDIIDFTTAANQVNLMGRQLHTQVQKIFGDADNVNTVSLKPVLDKYSTDQAISALAQQMLYEPYNINIAVSSDSVEKAIDWTDNYIKERMKDKKYKFGISYDILPTEPQKSFVDKGDNAAKQYKAYAELAKRLEKIKGRTVEVDNSIKELIPLWENFATKVAENGVDKFYMSTTMLHDAAVEGMNAKKQEAIEWGVDPDEKKNAKKERDIWQERIDLLNKMHSQYEEARKYLNDEEANTLVHSNFKGAIAESGIDKKLISQYVPTKEGLVKALQEIKKSITDFKKRNDIEQQIAKLNIEIETDKFQKDLEKKKREVEEALSGMKLRVKLEDLGLNGTQIQKLFPDLEMPKGYEEMLKKAQEKYGITPEMAKMDDKDLEKMIPTENVKAYRDFEKQINKERVEESRNTITKLVQDYKTKMSAQLEIDFKYAKLRKQIMDEVADPSMRTELLDNLDKEKSQKKDKQAWEDFKGTDMYTRMFENLEGASSAALRSMLGKLNELRTSLTDLDPTQMKEIINLQDKIGETLYGRNPFDSFIMGAKEYFTFLTKKPDMERGLMESQKKEAEQEEDINSMSTELSSMQQMYEAMTPVTEEEQKQKDILASQITTLEGLLQKKREENVAQKQTTKQYADGLKKGSDASKKFNKGLKDARGFVTKAGGSAKALGKLFKSDVANSVSDTVDCLEEVANGVETIIGASEDLVNAFTKTATGVVDGASQAMKGASVAAVQSMSTMEKASVILTIISAALQIAMAIVNLFNSDKKKDEKIAKIAEEIENLQDKYEKLSKAMDEAYNINKLRQYNKEMEANLKKQQSLLREQASLERSKKDSDEKAAKEYEKKVEEINEQIRENKEAMTEALGGFGSGANYKSAAEEFTEAWMEAFKEGEDGLGALNDKFDDFFLNLLKKQVLLKLGEKYLTPIMENIDQMVSDGSAGGEEITRQEIDNLQKLKDKQLEGFDAAATALMDLWGVNGSFGGLSKLQQGIEGITENTAEALESLLNSMRLMVAREYDEITQIRQLLAERFADTNTASSPMLVELKTQTTILRSMNSLWESVVGSANGGRGLRVIGIS